MNKIYTAFISSAFSSLRDERAEVINTLLDYRILPIGMEHFTVSSNGEFSDIQDLIDESDFFIMLMGQRYGSCDENGVSWTEREYQYANTKKMPVFVIICDELDAIMQLDPTALDEDQLKQVAFAKRISFARTVTKEFDIKKIVSQFLNNSTFSKCVGWTRTEAEFLTPEKLEFWRKENSVFDIAGTWYHVHLSDEDETYIRVGTIKIEQDFSPDRLAELHFEGMNFSVDHYDESSGVLRENKMKSSRFVGEYTLKKNGEIFGIFNSKRMFSGTFNDTTVNKGTSRGIHDFTIDVTADRTDFIEGEFHDEAPSPKLGRIFIFRDINDRNSFLLENRRDVITIK